MKRLFAAVALLATFTHVSAGEMSLYSKPGFRGPELLLRGATPNFVDRGFNDRTSSIVVHSGTWEVCEHKDFGGHCTVLERGRYEDMSRFNNAISSAREVDHRRERGGHRDRNDRNDRRNDERRGSPVELFTDRDFGGERVMLTGDARSLNSRGFNDRASSLVVREGEWEVCEHDDYRGRCRTYGPGRYRVLDGANDMASSVRRVR